MQNQTNEIAFMSTASGADVSLLSNDSGSKIDDSIDVDIHAPSEQQEADIISAESENSDDENNFYLDDGLELQYIQQILYEHLQ